MASVGTVISYPIPAYQNVPIHIEFYIPQRFDITAISLGQLTTVTTSVDHDYVIGQECRFVIPPSYGTRQLNQKTAFVVSIPSTTQVTLEIDSSQMDAFVSSSDRNQPQILAIGDVNTGVTNPFGRAPTYTYIPGSFRDISPY